MKESKESDERKDKTGHCGSVDDGRMGRDDRVESSRSYTARLKSKSYPFPGPLRGETPLM
jgi:hypothetical protein